MALEDLARHWHAFGEQDPLWSILTRSGTRGGAWDLEEFFATGRADVDDVLGTLDRQGIKVGHGRALDFGCGVGRLTQALARHFEVCDGIDVAASMIERARDLGDSERVHFHHNPNPDLRLFDDAQFDFVLALIVLQHMEPDLMRGYMREFVRVLRPGGVAFFNVPERYRIGEALPADAFRAAIDLSGELPSLASGQVAQVGLRVRNDSPRAWPAGADVLAGNHWLAADGRVIEQDDGRVAVGQAIAPGDECTVALDVVAPRSAGEYVLELDLVQEWIGWFADRGSPTLRVPVTVSTNAAGEASVEAFGSADGDTDRDTDGPPQMEMHVLGRAEVVETIESAGGAVVAVLSRARCGPAIPSLDYVITRRATGGETDPPVPSDDAPSPIRDRIRALLEAHGVDQAPRSSLPQMPDPQLLARRRSARRSMREEGDLVSFPITSELPRIGAVSVLIRRVLRRAMRQVFIRQTNFNRGTVDFVENLETTLNAQLAALEAADLRIHALELSLREALAHSDELERRLQSGESIAEPK